MRVIAGKYKGRNLVAPQTATRPTLDRMKETLFNILGDSLIGANVLDLFAGSGQIAIECLSRGAAKVVLCDNNRGAVAAIKSNFSKIGETPDLYFCDFADCLRNVNCKMDFIYVDPPYESGFYNKALLLIDNFDVLSQSGLVVCEHSAEVELSQYVGNLLMFDCRKIGTVKFSFYKRSDQ